MPGLSTDHLLGFVRSYGHDSGECWVRRVNGDLEKRGHDVWFDENEIKSDPRSLQWPNNDCAGEGSAPACAPSPLTMATTGPNQEKAVG